MSSSSNNNNNNNNNNAAPPPKVIDLNIAIPEGEETVLLTTNDSQTVRVKRGAVMLMITLKNLFSDIPNNDGAIPISNVASAELARIVYLLDPYIGQTITPEQVVTKGPSEREKELFATLAPVEKFKFVLAVNYLDVPYLLHVGCKVIADNLKSMTREEIKTYLGISVDFTPEQEKAARADPAWVGDYGLPSADDIDNNNNNNDAAEDTSMVVS